MKIVCDGCQKTLRSLQTHRDRPVCPVPALHVTVLKHCRCRDCRKFYQVGGEYFCQDHIGGTAVVWTTGEKVCDPPPDAWHYCAGYDGPQVSKDVWVWRYDRPRTSHQVPPRSTIAPEVGQPDAEEVLI